MLKKQSNTFKMNCFLLSFNAENSVEYNTLITRDLAFGSLLIDISLWLRNN